MCCGVCSGVYSGVCSGVYSGVCSGVSSGVYSGVCSGVSSGVCSGVCSVVCSGVCSVVSIKHTILKAQYVLPAPTFNTYVLLSLGISFKAIINVIILPVKQHREGC